ncbi:MAG: histidinol-phosphatase [Firmicutes bacterium HGW-Firmicutes-13]|nr:MAG: histidinol-phosphatase [Firmicutes bacterium HGW-Firmicutes-13]
MNIDMHVHTKVSSPCSSIDIYEMIEYARHIGLDAVCVTDHDTLYGAEIAQKIGKEKGFPVFRGIEVNTYEGDFLVFGLKKDINRTVSARELLRIVTLEGGAAVVAHPYRQFERALGNKIYSLSGYDAVEVKNGNTPVRYNKLAQMAAADLNMPGIGGSDAHQVEEIGRCYTKFTADITTEQELIKAIKSGNYEAKTSIRTSCSMAHYPLLCGI